MKERFFNIPNMISMGRIVLLLFLLLMVLYGDLQMLLYAAVLSAVIIFLDWLDGYVARKYKMVTKIGAALDIAADRIVENVFWIILLFIGMVPVWIPVIFIMRGFLVDVSRAHSNRPGWSVIHSKLGELFVSSRLSRGLYGFSKAVAYVGSFLLYYLKMGAESGLLTGYQQYLPELLNYQSILVWFVAAFCLIRGIVTISDSIKFME